MSLIDELEKTIGPLSAESKEEITRAVSKCLAETVDSIRKANHLLADLLGVMNANMASNINQSQSLMMGELAESSMTRD